jgi:hypothetical protein
MVALLCFLLALFAAPFKSKSRLDAESAALRRQLKVLRRGREVASNSRTATAPVCRRHLFHRTAPGRRAPMRVPPILALDAASDGSGGSRGFLWFAGGVLRDWPHIGINGGVAMPQAEYAHRRASPAQP